MDSDNTKALMAKTSFFKYKQAEFHYWEHGNGPTTILAFHGYGQTKDDYRGISKALGNDFRLISFDLFFHGGSSWNAGDSPISRDFLADAIGYFLQLQNIERFSLMGFSMGGKFALSICENFPERIDNLILIAPDGIQTSFWYSMATYPIWARGLFRKIIINPGFFKKAVRLSQILGLLDKGMTKFVEKQMDTRAKRRQVYYSWTVFRHLKIDKKKLMQLLNHSDIRVHLFTGKHDKVISSKSIRDFFSRVKSSKSYILDAGHSNLLQATAQAISKQNLAETFSTK